MLSDLRYAMRRLRRTPGVTIATIVTLAVGIGATTAVYSVFDGVLLKPLPFDRPERVVTIAVARQDGHFGVSGGVIETLHRLPAIERAAVFIPHTERTLRDGMDPEQLPGALVSAEFFSVFGTAPLVGRTFADQSGAGVPPLVLSERLWRRRFGGDRSAIGRLVTLEGRPHAIVGVMPGRFPVPEEAEFWAPLPIDAQQLAEIGTGPFDGVARLRSSDIGEASLQAGALSESLDSMARAQQRFVLIPMLDAIGQPYRSMLVLLLAASGMVLLIACANAANLSVAQMRRRTQELAVRSAIGATRGRLVRQLATESLGLTAAAAVCGLCLAWILLRVAVAVAMSDLPRIRDLAIDWRVGAYTVMVSGVSLIVFGVLPAWFSLRARPPVLDGTRNMTMRGRRFGTAVLVATEVAVALVLSVGSALTLISVFRAFHVDPGFDARRFDIVTLRPSVSKYTGADRARFHERHV
jgi:putative ABC transport system permease protein